MIGMVQPLQPGGYAGDGVPADDGRPRSTRSAAPAASSASARPRTAGCCSRWPASAASRSARELDRRRAAIAASRRLCGPYRADLDAADELVELDRERLMAALAAYFAAAASVDRLGGGEAGRRPQSRDLAVHGLPFGPVEKQALLEAADTSARAKLLVGFLEMGAFAPAAGHRRSGPIKTCRRGHEPSSGAR